MKKRPLKNLNKVVLLITMVFVMLFIAIGSNKYEAAMEEIGSGPNTQYLTDLSTLNVAMMSSDAHLSELEYKVSTTASMKVLADLVNKGITFTGKTIYMTNNINFGGTTLNHNYMIGRVVNNVVYPFKGTFNGQNYQIQNYVLVNSTLGSGTALFGRLDSAKLLNFSLTGSVTYNFTANGAQYVGGPAGYASNTLISNVYNYAAIMTNTQSVIHVSGICGGAINTTIISCGNHGAITGTSFGSAGIVGDYNGPVKVINCYNRGTIFVGKYQSESSGGIMGCMHASGAAFTKIAVKNVFNMAGSSTNTYIWPFGITMFYDDYLPNIDMVYTVAPTITNTFRDYGRNKPTGSIYSSVGYLAPNQPDAVGNTYNGYMQKFRNNGSFLSTGVGTTVTNYTSALNNNLPKLALEFPELEEYLVPWKTVSGASVLDPSVKNPNTLSVKVQSGTTGVVQNNNQFVSEKNVSLGIGFTITNNATSYITRYSYQVNNKPESPLQAALNFNIFEAGKVKVYGYYYNNATYEKVKIAVYEFTIYDSHDKTITQISNAEELLAFAVKVNSGDSYKGKTVVLTKDITLPNAVNNMISIGTSLNRFEGTFDGQGFAIYGLNKNVTDSTGGLFGYVRNAVIGNFTLRGNVKSSTGNVGGAINVSQGNTIIHNIFNYTNVIGGSYNVGGIVANLGVGGVVLSCANYGAISGPSWGNAGIVGEHGGLILNCYNRGTVPNNSVSGGIFGCNHALTTTVRNTFDTSYAPLGLLMFRTVPTAKLNDIYSVSGLSTVKMIREYSALAPNGTYYEYGYGTANYNNYKRLWIAQGYLTREAVWSASYAKQIDTVYTMNDNVLSLINEYPEYKDYFRYWYQSSSIDNGYPSFYKSSETQGTPIRPGTIIPSPTLTPSFNSEAELLNGIYYFTDTSFSVSVNLPTDTLLKHFEYSFTGTGNWTLVPNDRTIHITGVSNERVQNTLYVRTVSIINTYSVPTTLKYIRDITGPNAPILSVSTVEVGKQPSNQNYYNYDCQVNFTHDAALDGANSVGVSYYEYKINEQSGWTRANTSSGIIGIFKEEGDYTVYFRAVDKLGNVGTMINEISFTIDKTPPSTPIIERDYLGLWANEKATLTFINKENDVTYEYKITVGNYVIIDWTSISGNTLAFQEEGMYVIHVRARSSSGLVSNVKTENLRVDAGAPTINVSGNPTNWTNYIKLVAEAYDGDLGIGGIVYGWTEGYTESDALNAAINWNNHNSIEVSRNNFYYVAWAKDALDNISYEIVYVTRYDSVRPTSPEMKVQTLFISQNGLDWQHFMESSAKYEEYKDNKSSLVGKQLIEYPTAGSPGDYTGSNVYYYRWVDAIAWTKGLTRVEMKHGKDNSIGQVGIDYSAYMIENFTWVAVDYLNDEPVYFYLEDEDGLLSGQMDIYGQTVDNSGVTSEENLSYMRIVSARIDNVKPNIPYAEVINYYLKEGSLYITNNYVKIVIHDSIDALLYPADTDSGIDRIEYKIGIDGNWNVYDSAITIGNDILLTDNIIVYIRQIDKVNNASDEIEITVLIDKDSPELAGALSSSADYHETHGFLSIADITFSGSAIDFGSGLLKIEYSYDNFIWHTIPFDELGNFSFIIDQPGKYQIFFRMFDKAGNIFMLLEPLKVLYSNDVPIIDVSFESGWVSSDTKHVAFMTAYNDFNVTHYYLSLSDTRPSSTSDGWVAVNGDVFYLELSAGTYYIWAMNSIGTIGNAKIFIVDKLDTDAPVINSAIQEDFAIWTNSEKKVIVDATDEGSGILGFYITNDANDIPNKNSSWQLEVYLDLPGTYYIYAIDQAFNISLRYTVIENHIDITAPIVSNVRVGEGYITVALIDEENGSGIKGYYVSNSLIINLGFINQVTGDLLNVEIYGVGNVYVWAIDNAGNISELPTQVTVPNNDNVNPTITSITVDNTNWVKGSRDVILKFADNSRLYGYKISETATLPSDDEWIMGQTITGKQKATVTEKLTNGTYYLWVRDLSGNTVVSQAFTVSKVDTLAPTVNISYSSLGPTYARSIIITVVASDNESGLHALSYKFNNEDWKSSNTFLVTHENEEVLIEVMDAVGNVFSTVLVIDWIDTTGPVIDYSIINEDTYTNANKEIIFEISDQKSGLYGYIIKDDNVSIPTLDEYKAINESTITLSKFLPNGIYYLWVIDNCGNYTILEFEIKKIDMTIPTFTVNGNPELFQKEATLYVEDVDYGKSGIHPEGSISFDGGVSFSSTNSITVNSNKEITVMVRNLAGNIGELVVLITKVDGIAPTVLIDIQDGAKWTNTDKLVTIVIADNQNGSGVLGYYISSNPQATPNETDFLDYDFSISGYFGLGTYYIYAIDNTLNISSRYTFVIDKIDFIAPTITVSHDGDDSFIVNVNLLDNGESGLRGIYYAKDININSIDLALMTFVPFTDTNTEIDVLGTGVWYFIAEDNALNISDIKVIKLYGNLVDKIRGLIIDIGHVTLESKMAIEAAEAALLEYVFAVGNKDDAYDNVGLTYINALVAARDLYDEKVSYYNAIFMQDGHNLDEIIDPDEDDLYHGYSYYLRSEVSIKYTDAESSFGTILADGILLINEYTLGDEISLINIKEDILRAMKDVPMRYTISFNSNGGTYVQYITGDAGTDLEDVSIPIPEKPMHAFLYWAERIDISGNLQYVKYIFKQIPNENITLYAIWLPIPQNLTGRYKEALQSVILPIGWSWIDGERLLDVPGEYVFEATYDFIIYEINVEVLPGLITGFTATGIHKIYDTKDTSITINDGLKENDIVHYRVGVDGPWLSENPVFNDVISEAVYVRIDREYYEIYISLAILVVITPADIPQNHFTVTNISAEYEANIIHYVTVLIGDGYDYQVMYRNRIDGEWVATNFGRTNATEALTNGEYVVYIRIINESNENYNRVLDTYGTIKITKALPEVNPILEEKMIYTTSVELPEISISASDVSGIISWDSYTIPNIYGIYTFNWSFVPADTMNYSNNSGSIEIYISEVLQNGIEVIVSDDLPIIYSNMSLDTLKNYLTVNKIFNDSITKEPPLNNDEYTLSVDSFEAGENVMVKVTHKDTQFVAFFKIDIVEFIQTGIAVTNNIIDMVYTSTELDSLKQYIIVMKTYNDGSKIVISADSYHLKSTNWEAEANKEITVTEDSTLYEVTFNVSVLAVEPKSIEAEIRDNTAVIYTTTTNEQLKDKIKVVIEYNDETKREATTEEFMISGSWNSPGSNHTIVVRLIENTSLQALIENLVTVAPAMTHLEIVLDINKKEYYAFEELSLEGLELLVHYNDGLSKQVDHNDIKVKYETDSIIGFRYGDDSVVLEYYSLSMEVDNIIVYKALPIVNALLETNSIYESSINLPVIYLDSNSTKGTIQWDSYDLSLYEVGEYLFGFNFTPTDIINFDTASGSISILILKVLPETLDVLYSGDDKIPVSTNIDDLKQFLTVTINYNDGTKSIAFLDDVKLSSPDWESGDVVITVSLLLDESVTGSFMVTIFSKPQIFVIVESNTTFSLVDISLAPCDRENYVYDETKEVYLVGLALGDTLDLLINQFDANIDDIRIYAKAGGALITKENYATKTLATGMVVQLVDEDMVLDSITLVVRGDINGDGRVNVTDRNQINNYINKVIELSGANLLAADNNADGRVNVTDRNRMNNYINKLIDLYDGLSLKEV